jgi:hypothetical protein
MKNTWNSLPGKTAAPTRKIMQKLLIHYDGHSDKSQYLDNWVSGYLGILLPKNKAQSCIFLNF